MDRQTHVRIIVQKSKAYLIAFVLYVLLLEGPHSCFVFQDYSDISLGLKHQANRQIYSVYMKCKASLDLFKSYNSQKKKFSQKLTGRSHVQNGVFGLKALQETSYECIMIRYIWSLSFMFRLPTFCGMMAWWFSRISLFMWWAHSFFSSSVLAYKKANENHRPVTLRILLIPWWTV